MNGGCVARPSVLRRACGTCFHLCRRDPHPRPLHLARAESNLEAKRNDESGQPREFTFSCYRQYPFLARELEDALGVRYALRSTSWRTTQPTRGSVIGLLARVDVIEARNALPFGSRTNNNRRGGFGGIWLLPNSMDLIIASSQWPLQLLSG